MKEWKGLMKVLEIRHLNQDGKVLYKEENIKNLIHYSGEELILKILFGGTPIPERYHIGLDSRTSLNPLSDISDLFGLEPTSNSYERQSVDSNNFSVVSSSTGWQANTPIITFRALGGSWGPVKNIFMTAGLGYSSPSVLISSASLNRNITVSAGESVTMRMAMALSDS